MSKPKRYLSHDHQPSNIMKDLSNLIVTTQNKFEERDNMLRESSIAEDYWKQVIDEIKQQEAKIAEEQNDKVNSTVVDSVQTKNSNKTKITVNILIFSNFYRCKQHNDTTK
jgi:hypothetical protein